MGIEPATSEVKSSLIFACIFSMTLEFALIFSEGFFIIPCQCMSYNRSIISQNSHNCGNNLNLGISDTDFNTNDIRYTCRSFSVFYMFNNTSVKPLIIFISTWPSLSIEVLVISICSQNATKNMNISMCMQADMYTQY